MPKLFYGWSPFWAHHKILKRNPCPDSLSDCAQGVSAKKIDGYSTKDWPKYTEFEYESHNWPGGQNLKKISSQEIIGDIIS